MIGSLIVNIFLLALVCMIAGVAFFVWLWRKKSAEDKRDFAQVLNEPTVETQYDIKTYTASIRSRDKES